MIGLATPYKTQNYGTKLQAYAMQTIFSEIGYDTEIINYTHISSKKDKILTLLSPKKLREKPSIKKQQKKLSAMPFMRSAFLSETTNLINLSTTICIQRVTL